MMNEMQKYFLHELSCVLKNYNVDSVNVKDSEIIFKSNDATLSFSMYENGVYSNISTTMPQWSPTAERRGNE